jgi:RHS repeat-associated protein
MKKSRIICTFLTSHLVAVIILVLLHINEASACNYPPTAVIVTSPSGTIFYNGNPILLNGSNSSANNGGSINQYRWRVRPVGGSYTTLYTGSSPTYNYTFPTLGSGENQKSYQIELQVRNTSNQFHTTTITVTLKHAPDRYYYVKDHLGSVRLTLGEDGGIVSWNDYDPWGLALAGRSGVVGLADARYKFTSQERDNETGYDYFGARYYDPRVGRWGSIDPLAGKYPGWSPYNYVLGNPLRFVDPDGREVWAYNEDWIKRIASGLNERIPGIGISYEQRTRDVEDGDGNIINEEYYALTILEDSGFDWGEDIYTNALYDVISSTEIDFKVIVGEKYYGDRKSYHGTSMKSWGGGRIDPRSTGGDVWLHPDPATKGVSFISIFLHEAVGHGHPNMTNATAIEERFGLSNLVPHNGFVGGIRWREIDLYKKRR